MSAIGMPSASSRDDLTDTGETSANHGARGLLGRLTGFFGLDAAWERPRPPLGRRDLYLAVGAEAIGLITLELMRSLGVLQQTSAPIWLQWLAISIGAVLLLWRRRYPLTVASLAAAHMFATGVTMPAVMGQMTLQIAYFVAFFSAVAWARDRRLMLLVVGSIVAFMFAWLVWQYAVGSGVQEILDSEDGRKRFGLLDPVPANVALTFLINAIYFSAAIISGQFSWWSARQRERLIEQAVTIKAQSQALQRRAVVDERLRIARELHDVVGHHVSVIGVQAGAARRVLTKDPVSAATALSAIETSSRDAVNQMRGLLGTLRDIEEVDSQSSSESGSASGASGSESVARKPEPGVGDLDDLVTERRQTGLQVDYELVEDPVGAAAALPGPVSLTLYRVAQEALANVTRHSTATSARLVVRVVSDEGRARATYAEVEVVDSGRPRVGTSGSGLGQLGMRERAQSLGAVVDIGPRATGGYRVRVRIPLGEKNVRGN